jgi:outer membrane protein assembly factor BamB
MNRRTLLASLGTAALAGCLDDSSPATESGTSTHTPSRTPSGTPATPETVESAWPVPNHDAGLSNYAPDATGPTTKPGELWRHSTGASLSAPVVADGTLYVGGDDGVVRAFDARTGEAQWQTSVGAAASTPHVVDGQVVVPTASAIVALGTDGAGPQWQVETPARRGIVVADHGIYYVATGEETMVVARERSDGTERWRAPIQDPWAPPVFTGAGEVFVTSRGSWDTPWRFAVDSGEFRGRERPTPGGADFVVSQFYLGGSVFGAKELFSTVTAHAVTDDGYDWRTGIDGAACFGLAAGGSHLYARGRCIDRPGLFGLSLSDGREVWYAETEGRPVARPVVTTETVLVLTEDRLHCFAPSNGIERWRRPVADVGEAFVVADDLLFTTQGDTVRALR